MQRRTLLQLATAATGLTAIAGCTQNDDGGPTASTTTAPSGEPTTDSTMTEKPADETRTEPTADGTDAAASEMAYSESGELNGVQFAVGSGAPECGQGENSATITFGDADGEVVIEGVIGGSDLCKRATLASVDRDTDDTLSVTVDTTDRPECADGDVAGGQCIVDITYRATLSVETLPSAVTVSHANGSGFSVTESRSSGDSQ